MLVWKQGSAFIRPTPAYETFWRFAAERQRIFFARINGEPWPWTKDPTLRRYRFTNVYRVTDRVTQYLIRHVVYSGSQDDTDVFLRTMVFKLFNKVETWERMRAAGIRISNDDFDSKLIGAALEKQKRAGHAIYSAAYIMPPGPRFSESKSKHDNHLAILQYYRRSKLSDQVRAARTMRDAFEVLCKQPLLGSFLAFQILIDLNYSRLIDFSENDFVVAGPGAKSGISKCFPDRAGFSYEDVIRIVAERQDEEFASRGLSFENLYGRPLQLIDIQNLFCELDKYCRVVHPEILGLGERWKIKRGFAPNPAPLPQWYPPKWKLNSNLEAKNGTGAFN